MPSPSDCNLLFGILALQMDFIARDALIASMHAWVLAKSRPLGDILQDQGALQADDRALLDALVQRHLLRHDNDVQRSLAAVSSIHSARQHLERIADADVQASLAQVAARSGSDSEVTSEHLGPGTQAAQARYRILRPHAQGGLGEVFVAR